MTELHWPDYVGMVSGLIGTITGVAGAIMGYISYRKANSLKSLDLRLELRRAVTDCHEIANSLSPFIDQVDSSRKAVASASGRLRSGIMERWVEDVAADRARVSQLIAALPNVDELFQDLQPEQLESKLVEVHRLKLQVASLKDKYDSALQADDQARKEIRANAQSRHVTGTT